MFLKTGDGKILGVIDGGDLTDDQKKSAKQASKEKDNESTDSSNTKKSGS